MNTRQIGQVLTFLAALNATPVQAHVKWFVEFDISEPPRSLPDVINVEFAVLLGMASLALFAVYALDIHWTRSGRLSVLEQQFSWHPDIAASVVRIGTGIFCLCLWLMAGVILTPETAANEWFIPYLHFFTAFFVLFRRTLPLSALGIIILYAYAISVCGLFHMIDYVIFLGIAAFLIMASVHDGKFKNLRLRVLYFSLVFSFLWSSIEKFAYVEWFQPFLDANEALTMGLPRDIFLMCAAFVEFTLVFLLFTGGNIVALGAIALNALIISAALYFGKVDAIGHFPVIITLIVIAIKGAENFPILRRRDNGSVLLESTYLLVLYWTALVLLFAMYYGIHWMLYG